MRRSYYRTVFGSGRTTDPRKPPVLKGCFVQLFGEKKNFFVFLTISYLCNYYEQAFKKSKNTTDLHNHTQRRQYSKQLCSFWKVLVQRQKNRTEESFDPHLLTCGSNTDPGFQTFLWWDNGKNRRQLTQAGGLVFKAPRTWQNWTLNKTSLCRITVF